MSNKPIVPVIEIIETGGPDAADWPNIIVPNDVRINGVSVLCSDEPITVHEMIIGPGGDAVARVTLTLFASRVVIASEPNGVSK